MSEYGCRNHNELNQFICLHCEKLLCQVCSKTEHPKSFLYHIRPEITQDYLFIDLIKFNSYFYDCLIKHLINDKKYILRIFNGADLKPEIIRFYRKKIKEKLLLLNHKNLQKTFYFKKFSLNGFYILFEYFEKQKEDDFMRQWQFIFILKEIIEAFDYLHNKLFIYHGDFSSKSIRISRGQLKIVGTQYPFLSSFQDSEEILIQQKNDIKDIGLLFYEILANETFSFDSPQKLDELLNNSQKYSDLSLLKLTKYILDESQNLTISKIQVYFYSLFPDLITKKIIFPESSQTKHHKTDFHLSDLCNLQKTNSIVFEICEKRELLEKIFQKVQFDFHLLAQSVSFEGEIDCLRINVKPSFLLVKQDDNWRKFWWYAFYFKKNVKNIQSEISLSIQSKEDWDNGISCKSAMQILDLLKFPWIRRAAFKEVALNFHSYLYLTDEFIERIQKTIRKMNFAKLKHFEIVVTKKEGCSRKFFSLIEEIEEKMKKEEVQLFFFSLLFNSIRSLNLCVRKIGEIALYQKKLETFKIWIGDVNEQMDTTALTDAFSQKFMGKLKCLALGFNSWQDKKACIHDSNLQKMFLRMNQGISGNLKELHIWLWSREIIEDTKMLVLNCFEEKKTNLRTLNIYFDGWVIKKYEDEEINLKEACTILQKKNINIIFRSTHIKVYKK